MRTARFAHAVTSPQLAAYVAPTLLRPVRVAASPRVPLLVAADWPELLEALGSGRASAAIVSPPMDLGVHASVVARGLVALVPASVVIVYTLITPDAVRGLLEFARLGIDRVVLRGDESEVQLLHDAIECVTTPGVGSDAFARLAAVLGPCPASIRATVRRLYDLPGRFADVGAVARDAGVARRTFDRWLARVGVRSARRLVIAARVSHTYHYATALARGGADRRTILQRLGWSHARVCANDVRTATGWPLRELRARMSPNELADRLTAWVTVDSR